MTKRTIAGWAAFAAFVGTVYAANWALETYEIIDLPLTGLTAPAGVYFAGLAFGLRDVVHETLGRRWVALAIILGASLSYVISDGAEIPGGHVTIAVASGIAFLLSELADLAVYDPLRARRWWAAVIASNAVGAVVDSALFLWLAFGSLNFIEGQIVGKIAMILPVLPLVWLARRYLLPGDERPGEAQ
ncbi:MAG TPA: VUT family protein [Acidimicrobiales bacterium]|nr:VUT family protein [Acidimicrobiales bacterium]